ncbi:DNA-directed RNA polymerase subunit P [Candidatus Woesearchaeota archaeon]|nr:DNA-directed RNA polymerase subunit P [Candidatus Woesearchaeota archaeon]
MQMYKCFYCKKEIKPEHIRKRVRCVYCGSKILFKARTKNVTIQAR